MNGWQSALDPAGPQAERIGHLWWWMLGVSTVVFVAVIAALAYAVWHDRARATRDQEATEGRMTRAVSTGVVVTVAVLLVFVVADFAVGRRVATREVMPPPLLVEIVGHQFWWEVRYVDSVANHRVTTANEVHIPVGRPVVL